MLQHNFKKPWLSFSWDRKERKSGVKFRNNVVLLVITCYGLRPSELSHPAVVNISVSVGEKVVGSLRGSPVEEDVVYLREKVALREGFLQLNSTVHTGPGKCRKQ